MSTRNSPSFSSNGMPNGVFRFELSPEVQTHGDLAFRLTGNRSMGVYVSRVMGGTLVEKDVSLIGLSCDQVVKVIRVVFSYRETATLTVLKNWATRNGHAYRLAVECNKEQLADLIKGGRMWRLANEKLSRKKSNEESTCENRQVQVKVNQDPSTSDECFADNISHLSIPNTEDELPLTDLDQLSKKTTSISDDSSKTTHCASKRKSNSIEFKWRCPVCFEGSTNIGYMGNRLMSTQCGHIFCSACLEDIVQTAKGCPNCRAAVISFDQCHPIFMWHKNFVFRSQ